ncbi:MAG: hypothetical protein ACYTHJ_20175 [Planctomycetota bacterium]|jgi:hypothetical protein
MIVVCGLLFPPVYIRSQQLPIVAYAATLAFWCRAAMLGDLCEDLAFSRQVFLNRFDLPLQSAALVVYATPVKGNSAVVTEPPSTVPMDS